MLLMGDKTIISPNLMSQIQNNNYNQINNNNIIQNNFQNQYNNVCSKFISKIK